MAEFEFKIYFEDKISSLFLQHYILLLYKHKGNPLIWPLELNFFFVLFTKNIFFIAFISFIVYHSLYVAMWVLLLQHFRLFL